MYRPLIRTACIALLGLFVAPAIGATGADSGAVGQVDNDRVWVRKSVDFAQWRDLALEGEGVDFWVLRWAWTKTPAYAPFSVVDDDLLAAADDMWRAGKHRKCLSYLRQLMATAWPDYRVHRLASHCYTGVGKTDLASTHERVALGLQQSISQKGDGEGRESAWPVIDLNEVLAYAEQFNYRIESSEILDHSVKLRYKVVNFIAPGGERLRKWFDISAPYIKQFGYIISRAEDDVHEVMREDYLQGDLGSIEVAPDEGVTARQPPRPD